jgi:hypothetical protein
MRLAKKAIIVGIFWQKSKFQQKSTEKRLTSFKVCDTIITIIVARRLLLREKEE